MKIFKFQIRVYHFSGKKYTVQYSWRFIPFWYTIYECLDLGKLSTVQLVLFDYKKAEEFALRFKEYKDVKEYNKKANYEWHKIYKEQKIKEAKEQPYISKIIK